MDFHTFIFLVTFWTSDGNPPDVNVADFNLTAEDCIAAMVEYKTKPRRFGIAYGTPSCEFDHARKY